MDARALASCQGCVSSGLTGTSQCERSNTTRRALPSARWLLNRISQRATPTIELRPAKDGSPRREYRNDDLDLCSKTQPCDPNHGSDKMHIGCRHHRRRAGLFKFGVTRARSHSSNRACSHSDREFASAARPGNRPAGSGPERYSAVVASALQRQVPVRLSRIRG